MRSAERKNLGYLASLLDRGLIVDRQSELHGDAWPGVRGGPYASPVSFDNRTADR